jgi:hypothetical protein
MGWVVQSLFYVNEFLSKQFWDNEPVPLSQSTLPHKLKEYVELSKIIGYTDCTERSVCYRYNF